VTQYWKRYTLFGVVLYLVFLITQIPATLVYGLFSDTLEALPAKVKLYRVSGTVWSGKAAFVSASGNTLRDLSWELYPSSLLLGRVGLGLNFKLGDGSVKAELYRTLGGDMLAKNIRARMPMSDIVRMARLPAIKLEGDLGLNLESLVLSDGLVSEAQGRVVWNSAETRFPQRIVLGDLSANLQTTDAGIEATLGDGGGPLEASGKLTLAPDGAYNFDGAFASREGSNSPLARSLSMMGRPDAQGKVQIKNAGNIKTLGFLFK